MKSDHRHELKTNELADWLAHFPEWARENRTTLIGAAVVIVVAAAVYFWVFYQRRVVSTRAEVRLTSLVTQLPSQKAAIARSLSQGTDQSYVLLDLARDLEEFAQSEKDNEMAAVALLDRAEAIRAELHYRLGNVSNAELTKQISLAQASYQKALELASSTPSLAAKAQFGLGLCQEALGDFGKAREIYQIVASDPDYEGTVARAEAEFRLETMADYQGTIVFTAAPEPQPQQAGPQASGPVIQVGPNEANGQIVIPVPNDIGVTPVPESNAPAGATGAIEIPVAPTPVPEANVPAGATGTIEVPPAAAPVPEANVPASATGPNEPAGG